LMTVFSKYVSVNAEVIKVSLEKQGNFEVLEVNIVMPEKGSRA
ncbi:MAG TPA: cell division topological specificity factor MinE, partial [Accumulibacter sp.]|nr:cell division topological specificity factor MinE [Accumulibacter sp.]